MEIEVDSVLSGKVSGIVKFGAFVRLENGQSGLIHISEISKTFISSVSDVLCEGQDVTVKVKGIDDKNRISLSMKTLEPEKPTSIDRHKPVPSGNMYANRNNANDSDLTFEDKLKRFMQDSNNKIVSLKHQNDKKNNRKRGK